VRPGGPCAIGERYKDRKGILFDDLRKYAERRRGLKKFVAPKAKTPGFPRVFI
jgi:hypothetical protein